MLLQRPACAWLTNWKRPMGDCCRSKAREQPMIRVLLTVTYVLTSILLGGLAGLYMGIATGILCGFITLLGLFQLDGALARRRDRKLQRAEIAGLKRAGASYEKALNETRAKMEDINKAVEARATAQSRKIVSELQMLESLMREFAGKVSNKAREESNDEALGPAPLSRRLALLSRRHGRARTAGNHPRLARREPRRSLSAADRQPAAAQAALLRSAVASARRGRLGHHAGAIYQGRGARGADVGGRQSSVVPLRADRAQADAEGQRHRRLLQHLRRHAARCGILPAVPGIHASTTAIWRGRSSSNSPRAQCSRRGRRARPI